MEKSGHVLVLGTVPVLFGAIEENRKKKSLDITTAPPEIQTGILPNKGPKYWTNFLSQVVSLQLRAVNVSYTTFRIDIG